jgi:uncharacterized protein involved in exopolysaccharide biosynthesis
MNPFDDLSQRRAVRAALLTELADQWSLMTRQLELHRELYRSLTTTFSQFRELRAQTIASTASRPTPARLAWSLPMDPAPAR